MRTRTGRLALLSTMGILLLASSALGAGTDDSIVARIHQGKSGS